MKFMKKAENGKRGLKIDAMLASTFIMTMCYSSTYPCINKAIMSTVSDTWIAVSQIVTCVSIVIWGWIWNKCKKMYSLYSKICIAEAILNGLVTIIAIGTHNILVYYVLDMMVCSVVTRSIICGGAQLRSRRYKDEDERSAFDNNECSISAVATIVGSIFAIILKFDFDVMLILLSIGNAIDDIIHIYIYKKTK